MDAVRYARCLIAAIIRAPWALLVTIMCSVVMLLPVVTNADNGSALMTREYYQAIEGRVGATDDAGPVAELASCEDEQSFFGLLAARFATLADVQPDARMREGWLVRSALASSLSQVANSVVYQTCSSEGVLFYIASRLTDGVGWLCFAAPCLACCVSAAFLVARGRLLAQAPVGFAAAVFGVWLATLASSAVLAAAAALPCTFVLATRNGFGDASLPAAWVSGGVVCQGTVGSVLTSALVVFGLSCALLCLLTAGVGVDARSARGATCVACAYAALPLLMASDMVRAALSGILPYLPMTYLVPGASVGQVSYGDVGTGVVAGASAALGAVVLALSGVLAVAAIAVKARLLPRLGGHAVTSADDSRPHLLVAQNLSLGHEAAGDILACGNLRVAPGEVVGVVAPNGAGKTTLLRALGGDLPRYARGEVEVAGTSQRTPALYRRSTFYAGESDRALYGWLTPLGHLRMVEALWGVPGSTARGARAFGIEPYAHRRCARLSQGMAQLTLLACAFATGVPVLLLDEPACALDVRNVDVLSSAMRQASGEGRAVLMSSHMRSHVCATCSRVVSLENRRLVEVGGFSRDEPAD